MEDGLVEGWMNWWRGRKRTQQASRMITLTSIDFNKLTNRVDQHNRNRSGQEKKKKNKS